MTREAIWFDQAESFIYEYPRNGYVDPDSIQFDSEKHFDAPHSRIYRKMLQKYDTYTEESKRFLKEAFFDKIAWKTIVDLWSGRYECNLAVLSLLSNAKDHLAIDVNLAITDINQKKYKEFLIKNYKLWNHVFAHTTKFKNIMDDFENFLWRSPDSAWYSFTINGLWLTTSTDEIQEHVNRIMTPWSIIFWNRTENINIWPLLEGPFKRTEIILSWRIFKRWITLFEKLHQWEKSSSMTWRVE